MATLLSFSITLFAALVVISASNPVHSVLALIIVFVNGTIQFVMLGVDYLALTLLIVYVGAISILFLFVVMMLNIRLVELTENKTSLLPIGTIVAIIFFVLIRSALLDTTLHVFPSLVWDSWVDLLTSWSTIQLLAAVLYGHHFILLWISAFILLLALLGAISLTIDHERDVKRQDLFLQIQR